VLQLSDPLVDPHVDGVAGSNSGRLPVTVLRSSFARSFMSVLLF
jgi:hypothetical protein